MARIGWMASAAAAGVLSLAACGKKTETAANTAANATPAGQAAAPSAPAASPETLRPKRKAGLWEQTVNFGKMKQVSRICLDPSTDEKLGLEGNHGPNPCSENKVTPKAGGYEFSSVCDMGEGGKMTTRGEATGDFGSKYRVDMESTTTGASAPEMNGTRKFSIEAEWKGPCPADMKPGDIALPGGMKINPLSQGKAK